MSVEIFELWTYSLKTPKDAIKLQTLLIKKKKKKYKTLGLGSKQEHLKHGDLIDDKNKKFNYSCH